MTGPDPKAAEPSRPRRSFRVLWLAPILALVALMAWAFASPVGAAPDDDFHLASIWCANMERAELCLPGDNSNDRIVSPAIANATCYVGDPTQSADCQARYFDRTAPSVQTTRGNFASQYPPVYYAVMNLLATPDIQLSALLMRLLNVLLFVGGTVALWLLLPEPRRRVLLGMWLIASVPLGMFLIASNNPSSWAVTGIGLSWLAMLGFLEGTDRRRMIGLAVVAALAGVMAAGARGDAALYSVIGYGIAGVLAAKRERRFLVALILPVALSITAFAFFLSSQQAGVVGNGLGPAVGGAISPGPRPSDPISLLFDNLVSIPHLWVGVFGSWGLGWLDTVMPAVVWVAGFAVFAGVLFMSLRVIPRRIAVLMVLTVLVLWILPGYVLTRGGNVVGENVQPRYLLPLIVLVAGLALLPWRRSPIRLSTAQAVVAGVLLAGAQFVALNLNLRRYVTGTDITRPDLTTGAEWWWPGLPISPTAMWIVGSLAFAGLVTVLLREMSRDREPVA